jgi:NADH:ubiquinone oxidoreductase subunit E
MQGPNLSIGGDLYHSVTAAKLRELLQQLGSPLGEDHGTA